MEVNETRDEFEVDAGWMLREDSVEEIRNGVQEFEKTSKNVRTPGENEAWMGKQKTRLEGY